MNQARAIVVAAVWYSFEPLQQGNLVNVTDLMQAGSRWCGTLLLADLGVLVFTHHLMRHERL